MRREVLAQTAMRGPLLTGGPLPAPAASITYGSAGTAGALYRIACACDDAELLAVADLWFTRAVGEINDTGAFYDDLLDITPQHVGSLSFYHGPAGVYAVQALVAHARGDAALRSSATQAFIDICRQPCEVLDLTLGCAGALLDARSCSRRSRTTAFAESATTSVTASGECSTAVCRSPMARVGGDGDGSRPARAFSTRRYAGAA